MVALKFQHQQMSANDVCKCMCVYTVGICHCTLSFHVCEEVRRTE